LSRSRSCRTSSWVIMPWCTAATCSQRDARARARGGGGCRLMWW
jgi:hypothetical protein